MENEYVLEMKHITKHYGSNAVLSDVSLSVKRGEIHALLGENGAGKSTLMNTLFGMPVIHDTGGFEGEILLDGEKVNISSPLDAMRKGIGMVHQEFMLLPGFTIAENIKLNREITQPNLASRVRWTAWAWALTNIPRSRVCPWAICSLWKLPGKSTRRVCGCWCSMSPPPSSPSPRRPS